MKKKILVVDDEPDVRTFLKNRLMRHNYTVITASDGQECLEVAPQMQPDVILLDLVMPAMDGYEVIKSLRKNVRTKTIPIVMHSVRKETESIVKSIELGSIDYVTKPARFEELLKIVQRYT